MMKMEAMVVALVVAAFASPATAQEDWLALVERCAPSVAPATMLSVIIHESGGQPYRVGINKAGTLPAQSLTFETAAQASAAASEAIAQGRSVDMGLTQFNSGNLGRYGYRVDDLFDTCTSIAAGARVLVDGWRVERQRQAESGSDDADGQKALAATLSRYNTGSPVRGLDNGYVADVKAVAGNLDRVPAIQPSMPVGKGASAPVQGKPLASVTDLGAAALEAGIESDLDVPVSASPQAVDNGAQTTSATKVETTTDDDDGSVLVPVLTNDHG